MLEKLLPSPRVFRGMAVLSSAFGLSQSGMLEERVEDPYVIVAAYVSVVALGVVLYCIGNRIECNECRYTKKK